MSDAEKWSFVRPKTAVTEQCTRTDHATHPRRIYRAVADSCVYCAVRDDWPKDHTHAANSNATITDDNFVVSSDAHMKLASEYILM